MNKNRLSYTQLKTDTKGKRYIPRIKHPAIPHSMNDLYIITTAGDRLDSLAFRFYKDIRLWWVIADANRNIIRRDAFNLKVGLQLRIPYNVKYILKSFEVNNKEY